MAVSPLPRRLGIIYLLLAVHAALEAVMLMQSALRFIPGQLMFNLASVGAKQPENVVLVVHLLGLSTLASALRLWYIQHAQARLALTTTAIIHVFLAPFGLLVSMAVLWMLRDPEFHPEAPIAPIAGHSRSFMVLFWVAVSAGTWILCIPVLFLFGVNILAWFIACFAVVAPQALVGWWLMQRPPRQDAIAVMPELPEYHGQA